MVVAPGVPPEPTLAPAVGVHRSVGGRARIGRAPYNGAVAPGPAVVVLYQRPHCPLCDETRQIVASLLQERRAAGLLAPPLQEIDVTAHPGLAAELGPLVPVVAAGPHRLELAMGVARIRRFLAAALDGEEPAAAPSLPPR